MTRVESNWWVLPGTIKPAYTPRQRYRSTSLLVLLILILASIIGEITNYLPPGTSVLISTGVFIASFILSILGLDKTRFTRSDSVFLSNLVKSLKGLIVYWAVPSIRVPLTAMLSNGLYLVVYYHWGTRQIVWSRSRSYQLLLIKPRSGLRAFNCKPRVKVKSIRVIGRGRKTVYVTGRITFPHPYIRNTCYDTSGDLLYIDPALSPSEVLEIVRNYNKYLEISYYKR